MHKDFRSEEKVRQLSRNLNGRFFVLEIFIWFRLNGLNGLNGLLLTFLSTGEIEFPSYTFATRLSGDGNPGNAIAQME